MRKNAVLAAWRDGKQTVGSWLGIGNAFTAELMANLGFDWLCIDMQHGLIGYSDLKAMLPALSTTDVTPLVRVAWNEPSLIMRALDAGAYGVIVPMINNREEALKAVAACYYPPLGIRSYGPIRAALYAGSDYASQANREIACVAMIETAEGLDNLEEIVSTPGIDGVYIGPSDLSLALGQQPIGDSSDSEHGVWIEKIRKACVKQGVAAGIHTSSLEYTLKYLAQGFNFVNLGTDSSFMAKAALSDLKAARLNQDS